MIEVAAKSAVSIAPSGANNVRIVPYCHESRRWHRGIVGLSELGARDRDGCCRKRRDQVPDYSHDGPRTTLETPFMVVVSGAKLTAGVGDSVVDWNVERGIFKVVAESKRDFKA